MPKGGRSYGFPAGPKLGKSKTNAPLRRSLSHPSINVSGTGTTNGLMKGNNRKGTKKRVSRGGRTGVRY